MSEILSLKPEDEKILHPEAVRWFNARRAEIQLEVPLEELTDDDLNTFLSDAERCEFINCKYEITRGLVTCINMDEGSREPMTNANISLNLAIFQASALFPMRRIGLLLKHVYQRRVASIEQEQRERDEEASRTREQAEAEQRQKEERERWQAALKAVNPPRNDARRYLNGEEYDNFIQASLDAIEAYMEKGKDYLNNVRAFDYRRYLKTISDRKEKEKLVIAAKLRAREYDQSLNKEKMRLKSLLCPNKIDHESYFQKEIKDHRYTGQSFSLFLSREEEQNFSRTIVDISMQKIGEIVSSDFRQFIDSKCWWSYFLLPSAEYSFEGVPCLDFMFDVFAVVETGVWLKIEQKRFGGYIFDLPCREEKGYSVILQEPEFLGYHYLLLTPEDLGGYSFWQSIPLALLGVLLSGKTNPDGFTITAASDGETTYKIPGFKEEVAIPDSFADYLRSICGMDEMVSMGIITQKIAGIAKSELGELEIEEKAAPSEEKKGDSKKVKAFQLFNQGKGPSSPEVKALGLHKSTRFKYYNQYLLIHKP